MKNYFLILAALCCVLFTGCKKEDIGFASKIPSDPTEAFPDPNFRAYVLKYFDTDGDGKISEEEALAVTYIDVEKDIESMEGIQYFSNLTELSCSENNQLTSLDVSKNTKLINLCCYNTPLTSLDVSKNTELEYLACFDSQLTSLDVSKNTKLKLLWCQGNQLTSLDVNNNRELLVLLCEENQIEELDLSKTNIQGDGKNLGTDMIFYYPSSALNCARMETLKKVYLKKGCSIKGVTEDWDRSSSYIPDHTEIIFVD